MSWLVEWRKPASAIALGGFALGLLGAVFTAGGVWNSMQVGRAAQAAINDGFAARLAAVESVAAANENRNDLQSEAIVALRDDLVEAKTTFTTTLTSVDNTARDLIASVNQLAGKVDLMSRIIARTAPAGTVSP